MIPEQSIGASTTSTMTDLDGHLPRGSIQLENGYVLLRAQDQIRSMQGCEALAFATYLAGQHQFHPSSNAADWCPQIARWARLRLPNGQIARSRWKEILKPLDKIRVSRNVKVSFITSDLFLLDNDIRRFSL